MPPSRQLPLHPRWSSSDEYTDSLLEFVTTSDLFRNLCGGVHILDFLVRKPDIYSHVLPQDWLTWFDLVELHDFLYLILHADLTQSTLQSGQASERSTNPWRNYPPPPSSLIRYIYDVRSHSLLRDFQPVLSEIAPLPVHVSVGMKPKKKHEVVNFAAYVDRLSSSISETEEMPLSVIDFGSGQNYLGRTLACPPYNKHVIAIEQRHHNVEGARNMDVHARLAQREKVLRNKKEYKRQIALSKGVGALPTPPPEITERETTSATSLIDLKIRQLADELVREVAPVPGTLGPKAADPEKGSMTHIEHVLESGHLEDVLDRASSAAKTNSLADLPPESLVVSIHSCGNLTHHGLRSISLNPSVKAVAMIGCCYNLLTERLGPATYKIPQLRSNHPRLVATSSSYDPHGFPMSKRLEDYEFDVRIDDSDTTRREKGVRLNITARMMAVQAPYNWGREDTESYITRHFYRALLQRILLDRGVVKQAPSPEHVEVAGGSLSGKDNEGTPLIIGSLRKSAFTSFQSYVNAALERLTTGNPDSEEGQRITSLTSDLVGNDQIAEAYEDKYLYARKQLGIIWSLMAFSAGVVESTIVVDRWLWLKEQPEVADAWVETVFGYDRSPRNLCVVGVKRGQDRKTET